MTARLPLLLTSGARMDAIVAYRREPDGAVRITEMRPVEPCCGEARCPCNRVEDREIAEGEMERVVEEIGRR